jgi:hypothetical protein
MDGHAPGEGAGAERATDNAPLSVLAVDSETFEEEMPFTPDQNDVLFEVLRTKEEVLQAALAERDQKIAELNGRVDVLMKLLAGHLFEEPPTKTGEVVDLPANFWKRDAA